MRAGEQLGRFLLPGPAADPFWCLAGLCSLPLTRAPKLAIAARDFGAAVAARDGAIDLRARGLDAILWQARTAHGWAVPAEPERDRRHRHGRRH